MREPLSLNHIESLLTQLGRFEQIGEVRHRYALRRALMNCTVRASAAEPVFAWLSATRLVLTTGAVTVAVVVIVRFSYTTGAPAQVAAVSEQPAMEALAATQQLEPSPFATYSDFRPIPARELFDRMQVSIADMAR